MISRRRTDCDRQTTEEEEEEEEDVQKKRKVVGHYWSLSES